jgi:nucleotide-binding universal stress UspA family protein
MTEEHSPHIIRAIQDFKSARQKATMREIIARLTGESIELYSFQEVQKILKAQVGSKKVLKEIPIDAIIGSVNRYQDFSRGFLPRQNITEERWTNIETANDSLLGLPPIEVYQIDKAYFVSDGNHRVSVAKQLGATEIQAYVTEVHSRVPLTADIHPEDLILKAEYIEFLEHTNLDKVRPGSDLSVTEPGQYEVIEEHIAVHRYFMGIEQEREIPLPEAASDWYDKVYLPVVNIIQEQGLLLEFPTRTEADLYLWIAEHRAALEESVNSQIETFNIAEDLADQYSQRADRVIARLGTKIIGAIVPDVLASGPPAGEWRQSILSNRRDDRLFCEILVPINGRKDGWCALEQAILVANREGARIHGLYILDSEPEKETQSTQDIQNEYTHRCELAGIQSVLQLEIGDVTDNICAHARWNDLVVINLSYPPEASLLSKLSSGIHNLVQRCPRPILFTPQIARAINRTLLAYDGSLKAQEALFIAAYLAGQWNITIDVISVGHENLVEIQDNARNYLDNLNVSGEFLRVESSKSPDEILKYVEQHNIDLLLMGGYSRNPLMEVIQDGDVDQLLRQTKIPMIICR